MKITDKCLLPALAVMFAGLALSACGESRTPPERIADAYRSLEQSQPRAAVIEMRRLLQADPRNAQARVALGTALLQTRDAAAAEKEFVRAKELGAAPEEYLEGWARALAERRAYAELIAEIDPGLASSPELASTLHAMRATAMLALGSREEAEAIFDRELAAGASVEAQRIALQGKAALARRDGDLERAQSMLEQATAIAPDSAEALAALAGVLVARGEYDAALEALGEERAAQLIARPRDIAMLGVMRVEAHLGRKDIDAADKAAEQLRRVAGDHPMTTYLSGRVAFEKGETEAAVDYLQQSLSKQPGFVPAQSLMGASMLRTGDLEQADFYLASALSADPRNQTVRRLLAETRLRMNRPEAAQATIRAGLRDGGADPELLTLLGRASMQLGARDEGIEYLQGVLEKDPNNLRATLALASAYVAEKEGDKALKLIDGLPADAVDPRRLKLLRAAAQISRNDAGDARTQLEALLAASPGDRDLLALAGNFYLSIDEVELARQRFAELLDGDPDNRAALFGLLRAERRLGDYSQSRALLEARANAGQADAADMLALSRIYQHDGDVAKARDVIERANAIDPAALSPNLYLTANALRVSDIVAAKKYSAAAVAHNPRSHRAHGAVGMTHLRAREYERARDAFEKASELEPDDALYHYYIGEAQIGLGNARAAVQQFRAALEKQPDLVPALRGLGLMAMRANDTATVRRQIEALARYTDNAAAQEAVGDLEAALGNHEAAHAAYRRSADVALTYAVANKLYRSAARAGEREPEAAMRRYVAQAPSDARGRAAFAQMLTSQGHTEEAISEYLAVLELVPDSPLALNNLAWLYFDRGQDGDRAQALTMAARAFELVPQSADIADTYGWLLYQDGQIDEGVRILRRSLQETTPREKPEIAFHLAVALNASGNAARARDLLDAALSSSEAFASRDDARRLRESL